jgi:tetratricopeptide (TPR) repeat protein
MRCVRSRVALAFALMTMLVTPVVDAGISAQSPSSSSFEAVAREAANTRAAGKLDAALALYQRAVALKPDWDEGLWHVGSILYELNRPAEARAAFDKVIARQPEHAGAFGLKGLCEEQLGLHEAALRSLLRSRALGIARTPEVAHVVRYHAGLLLTRFAEFEFGFSVLSEFAQEGNESPAVIEAFGLNLLRLPILPSELAEARRPLVRLAGRAAFAMAARRFAAARPMLDELVATYPTTPNVHYARGIFRLTESPETALDDFKKELAISPKHVAARLQIAFELLRRGETAAARPFAEEAVRLEPDTALARLALGQAQLEAGDAAHAIVELERAVQLAPESPQTHFVLARAYARVGRDADAARERETFTKLDRLTREQRSGSQSVGGIASPTGPPPREPSD